MSRAFNWTIALTLSAGALYSKVIQEFAKAKIINYSLFQGQGGDFLAPVAFPFVSLALFGQTKRDPQFFFYPAICTLSELIPSGRSHFDPKDIACYWGGALMAYGIHKLSKSKKANDFANRLNPFRKKTLEEISNQQS